MKLLTLLGYSRKNVPFAWSDIKIVSPFIHQFILTDGELGFYVKPTANKTLPLGARNSTGWYKGFSAHIVVMHFRSLFSKDIVEESFRYLQQHYPNELENFYSNITIIPTLLTSTPRAIDYWYYKHRNCLIETKAWNDTHKTVPEGIYLVRASLAGDRFLYEDRFFFVPKMIYEKETVHFPFICNPCFHEERVLIQKQTVETESKPKPQLSLIVNNDRRT